MPPTARSTRFQIFLGLFLGLLLILIYEAAAGDYFIGSGIRTRIVDLDDSLRVRVQERGRTLSLRLEGEVELAADERGIARVGRGGRFDLEERRAGRTRRLEARPGTGGAPEISYFVGKRRRDFDAGGRAWLAELLPEVYRLTGIDAEARIERIYAAGGLGAVLDEVAVIPRDHVQALYLGHLVERSAADSGELAEVLVAVAEEVGSDYEARKVLAEVPAAALAEREVGAAYRHAAETIGSDYELRRLLQALVESPDLSAEGSTLAVDAAAGIGSDYELTELLVAWAAHAPLGEPLPGELIEVLATVGSDYEKRRALTALFARPGLEASDLDRLLAASQDIGSDYELAQLLVTWAPDAPPGTPLPDSLFAALATIGSDSEQRRAISAFVDRPALAPGDLDRLLEAALGIQSDYELAEVLVDLAEAQPLPAEIQPSLERVLETIGSDYEHQRAREALGMVVREAR